MEPAATPTLETKSGSKTLVLKGAFCSHLTADLHQTAWAAGGVPAGRGLCGCWWGSHAWLAAPMSPQG